MAAVPSLIFISGGVRSGKSSFAELLAVNIAAETGGELYYLATGVPFDSEMRERIQKHKDDRAQGKYVWQTIECPENIGGLAESFEGKEVVLLDCLTTLLNNELYTSDQNWNDDFLSGVMVKVITGIREINTRTRTLIVVSNEVFQEPLPESELIQTYKKILGKIHQQIVKEADKAYLVEAGIPIIMKGVRV